MKKVRVFAPASIANLGCGFDIMGLALDEVGDILEMTASEGEGITITNKTSVPLPEDIEDNVITPVIRKFFEMTGLSGHIDVTICQKIYPGSGIGSSAASSAAAAYGMNELFDCPLSDEEMVVCAMEGENLASGGYHADNAAPALMGGIILIRGYEPLDIIQLPIPGNFYCAVVHPEIVVSTKEARSILPKAVPMHDAISQWGNVGGLIAGLYSGNIGLYYDLEGLIKVIEKFNECKTPDGRDVVFAFVGAGSVLDKLTSYVNEHKMDSVKFIPYQDKDKLIYSLNAADVHWCVNAKGIKGVSCPSKFYGIAGVAKPVLAVLEKGSEIEMLISEIGCGKVSEPGDYKSVEDNIRWFIDNADSKELTDMGNKGHDYLVRNLTKDISIEKYIDVISKL